MPVGVVPRSATPRRSRGLQSASLLFSVLSVSSVLNVFLCTPTLNSLDHADGGPLLKAGDNALSRLQLLSGRDQLRLSFAEGEAVPPAEDAEGAERFEFSSHRLQGATAIAEEALRR